MGAGFGAEDAINWAEVAASIAKRTITASQEQGDGRREQLMCIKQSDEVVRNTRDALCNVRVGLRW